MIESGTGSTDKQAKDGRLTVCGHLGVIQERHTKSGFTGWSYDVSPSIQKLEAVDANDSLSPGLPLCGLHTQPIDSSSRRCQVRR